MIPNSAYYICLKQNKRIKEYEPFILEDSYFSYLYALKIIRDRWIEAESKIIESNFSSYYYAVHVIKGRWPQAESIIKTNNYYWGEYCKFIKSKCNWKIGL